MKVKILLLLIILAGVLSAMKFVKNSGTTAERKLLVIANEIPVYKNSKSEIVDIETPGQATKSWLIENSNTTEVANWYIDKIKKDGWTIKISSLNDGDAYIEASKDGKTLIMSAIKEDEGNPVSATIEVVDPHLLKNGITKSEINNDTENPEGFHTH